MVSLRYLLIFLFIAGTARAQSQSIPVFSAQGFAKASTTVDTSGSLLIYSPGWVALQTTTTGSDSSKIYIAVDAWINGVWSNAVTRDTVTLGRPAGHTLAASKGQVQNTVLRTPFSADLTESAYLIRVRNTHASGSADSISALTYTQNILIRP